MAATRALFISVSVICSLPQQFLCSIVGTKFPCYNLTCLYYCYIYFQKWGCIVLPCSILPLVCDIIFLIKTLPNAFKYESRTILAPNVNVIIFPFLDYSCCGQGMGEPLNNYSALVEAIHIMQGSPFQLSPKKITVSTVYSTNSWYA